MPLCILVYELSNLKILVITSNLTTVEHYMGKQNKLSFTL